MKDIYELLNDIDIDENEMDTMDVSEFEKEKVKKHLKKSIKKSKRWKKKALIAASLCCLVIGSVGVVGITNPAYAAEMIIVGDIFRFLDNGRTGAYEKYKDYAEVIGLTQESNGVSITIKEAIFDGKTLSYTYEIKTDKDLGEAPFLGMNGPTLKIKNYNGSKSGRSGTKKVDDNTYVGQDSMIIDEERKYISSELNFKDIGDMSSEDSKNVKGEWNFKINLKSLDSVKKSINKKIEKDGIKLNIDSISKTPVSFTLNYSQEICEELQEKWFNADFLIDEVKDDLGNIYVHTDMLTNGGGKGRYDGKSISNFGKLDENATKLIITPKVRLSNTSHCTSIDENGNEIDKSPTIDENHPEKGKIIFDDIVINLKK